MQLGLIIVIKNTLQSAAVNLELDKQFPGINLESIDSRRSTNDLLNIIDNNLRKQSEEAHISLDDALVCLIQEKDIFSFELVNRIVNDLQSDIDALDSGSAVIPIKFQVKNYEREDLLFPFLIEEDLGFRGLISYQHLITAIKTTNVANDVNSFLKSLELNEFPIVLSVQTICKDLQKKQTLHDLTKYFSDPASFGFLIDKILASVKALVGGTSAVRVLLERILLSLVYDCRDDLKLYADELLARRNAILRFLTESIVSRSPNHKIIKRVLLALTNGSQYQLIEALKLRVVVAGHDLKFIDFVYDYLPDAVLLREDKWITQKQHDVSISTECVNWSDAVWVEWLAPCAVWYSKNVHPGQPLIIRSHRYEILQDYGFELNVDRVTKILTIAMHTRSAVIKKFSFPENKVAYLPNIYEPSRYLKASDDDQNREFSLAIVGILPSYTKGFHRALELLKLLRQHDDRYTLTVFGKRLEDVPWLAKDPIEQSYFAACTSAINSWGLDKAVIFSGWVDLRAELRNYGFVLSMSEFEGSHVSPGEAFMSGNLGIFLRWPGVEYIYPEELVFDTVQEMADFILRKPLETSNTRELIHKFQSFLEETQSVNKFFSVSKRIILESM